MGRGFIGDTVTVGLFEPVYDPATLDGLQAYGSARVGGHVEFPNFSQATNVTGGVLQADIIDVSANHINLTLPESEGASIAPGAGQRGCCAINPDAPYGIALAGEVQDVPSVCPAIPPHALLIPKHPYIFKKVSSCKGGIAGQTRSCLGFDPTGWIPNSSSGTHDPISTGSVCCSCIADRQSSIYVQWLFGGYRKIKKVAMTAASRYNQLETSIA